MDVLFKNHSFFSASGLLISSTAPFDSGLFYDQKSQPDFNDEMHSRTKDEMGSCSLNGELTKIENGIRKFILILINFLLI